MSRSLVIPRRLRLLQALDRRLGPALCRWIPPATRATAPPAAVGSAAGLSPAAVRRVLIIRPGGLGDAALTWPMLQALRAGFPAAQLDVLAERRNRAVYELSDDWPGATFCYDADPLRLFARLRSQRYDLVIDTEQYHHFSTLVANALRPRWLAGFATLGRERYLTHPATHDEDGYEALAFLRLAETVLGHTCAFDPEQPFIPVSQQSLAEADEVLRQAGGRPLVAVMPGAGGAERLWPAASYAEVTRWLIGQGCQVVLLGGADGRDAAREIGRVGGDGLSNRVGTTTLSQAAGILARARLAISADSGVLHLACGVGAPTVALFGPGLHQKWAPRGRRHRLLRLGLPCSPCTHLGRTPACPINVACMRDLPPARVIAAAAELLAMASTP